MHLEPKSTETKGNPWYLWCKSRCHGDLRVPRQILHDNLQEFVIQFINDFLMQYFLNLYGNRTTFRQIYITKPFRNIKKIWWNENVCNVRSNRLPITQMNATAIPCAALFARNLFQRFEQNFQIPACKWKISRKKTFCATRSWSNSTNEKKGTIYCRLFSLILARR